MNIVFVGPFGLQPKGTMSVRALPLARALVSKGHAVTILIPPWDDPTRAGQTWNDHGVQVENVPLPPGIPLLFYILLTRTLAARVLTLKPDVVHFFKPKAYAGLAHLVLWWLRRLGGVKARLVLDADDWEQAWNEVLPYSRLQKKLFAWQETWGIQHADAVTAASREVEKLAGRIRGGQGGIFYVPNGCGVPAANNRNKEHLAGREVRERWGWGQESPVILLYSRFAEFRLTRVVTLVQRVAQRVPAARWLVVGKGLSGEDIQLARQLAQVELEDFVRLAGWQPIEALPACFSAADVAVYPYDDTLINRAKCSVKLVDLLVAGLPVVADAVGQNKAYIQHKISGILVPPEDDEAFAAALIELLQSPEKRQKLGQAAAGNVPHKFSWLRLSQEVESAYQ